MQCEKIKFDDLIDLHQEIKNFKLDVSFDVLQSFNSKTAPKFKKTTQKTNRMNLSSTATCTNALAQYFVLWSENKQSILTEKFEPINKYWNFIIDGLLKDDVAEIEVLDEFSILNILCALENIKSINSTKLNYNERIIQIINALCKEFEENKFESGGKPHPFIYYKFFVILERYQKILDFDDKTLAKFFEPIYLGGKYEMYRQIALHNSNDNSLFDVKKLIYSLLIVRKNGRYSDSLVVDKCLEIIFNEQLETGLLRIGQIVTNDFVTKNGEIIRRPVSTSPLLSSFECFNDMLSHEYVEPELKNYCNEFKRAYKWIRKRLRKDENGNSLGWYPEYESKYTPESWVSGHILIFLKNYCKMLSDLISENACSSLPVMKIGSEPVYDSYGIKENIDIMKRNSNYCSALVFGPPGTGKSTVPKVLANKLEWKYIEITPGLFLAKGQANIIPTINEIFKRLGHVKKAVIFFDEVDQLVKSRDLKGEAWIVTALLPKLAKLRKQKEIKFILATNRITEVDSAILREGRIDLILPMGGINWSDRLAILSESINNIFLINMSTKVERKLNSLNNEINKLLEGKQTRKNRIKLFLERTNFVSFHTLTKILNDIFDEKNISNFEKNELYTKFFCGEGSIGRYENQELRNFHKNLLGTLSNKIRLPIKDNENIQTIINNNIFEPKKSTNN